MYVPKKNTAGWAHEIISQCIVSRNERLQRGAMYRNIYLTGDENGEPQTYPRTFSFIDNLSSFLYSPVELRFGIEQYGYATAAQRAKSSAAASELHKHIRRGDVDTEIEEAVTWSLVKGKSFIKLLWTDDGFEPYIVQPEMMGVLREDIDSLPRQEAFVHSSFYTKGAFAEIIQNHPDRDELMKKAARYMKTESGGDSPESANRMKQVILGGLSPYQKAGAIDAGKSRGVVDWLGGPSPNLSPEVLASLIRLDELWVKDSERDDYTTIQVVGDDILLAGGDTHRNIFADMFDPENKERAPKGNPKNPLSGRTPFVEICPNRMQGYFWGRSEICNIALLQLSINSRINGINNILRRQEDPPRFFSGGGPPNQNAYNKLNKPGGYLVDQNPNAKPQTLAPEMPSDLFVSLHEYEQMFDQMAGFTPTMSGRGESGVRSQAHSETLVRTSSPRFKDRALLIERQVEEIGGLAFDILRAKIETPLVAWVMPKDETIEASIPLPNELEEPPIKGMKPIQFTFHDLGGDAKVVVDSHSSSPAFSQETKSLMFDLYKIGAVDAESVVSHTHPPGQDKIIEDLKRKEIDKQQFAADHPEIAAEEEEKASKKKKK